MIIQAGRRQQMSLPVKVSKHAIVLKMSKCSHSQYLFTLLCLCKFRLHASTFSEPRQAKDSTAETVIRKRSSPSYESSHLPFICPLRRDLPLNDLEKEV